MLPTSYRVSVTSNLKQESEAFTAKAANHTGTEKIVYHLVILRW